MGRPLKLTIDYFPHDSNASDGRTLTILENHFGHMGYSCWFKLLERVSSTRNQVIDTRNPESFEFLAAKLKISPEQLRKILDKMSDLEAIDPELYKAGYIWCQHFVDRIVNIYKNRNQELPIKPELSSKETPLLIPETPLSILESAPTKGTKGTKEKEILKKKKIYTSEELKTSEWYKGFLKEYPSFSEKEFNHALAWLEDNPGRKLNKSFLINWAKKLPTEIFIPGKLDKL